MVHWIFRHDTPCHAAHSRFMSAVRSVCTSGFLHLSACQSCFGFLSICLSACLPNRLIGCLSACKPKTCLNVEMRFRCPQAFLSLAFQCRDAVSELKTGILGLKRAVHPTICPITALTMVFVL